MNPLFDPVGVSHYLVVGAILFTTGLVCMVVKRNALGVLMGIELVLNGANVNFVAFGSPVLRGEQASILATVANAQFRLYSDHFAGKSRLSRRPARLERIVGTLTQTRDRMDALRQQGLHDPSNERNIGVVDGRLELYRKELEAVRSARQQTSMEALVRGLGEAANAAFDQYREHFAGQDRGTRDLQLLDSILEELHDMARQMDDLDRVRDDPANQRNLAIVLDQIRSYDREDQLIRDAKGP